MIQPVLILTDDDRADVQLERDRQRRLLSFEHQDWVRRRAAALRGKKPPRREGGAGARYRLGQVAAHGENATVTRSFRGRS